MATEHQNQKFCRVPLEKDAEFQKSIPAEGSVYFRPATTTLVVGDGATPGGVEFVSRAWVIQKISEANWKASQSADKIQYESSVTLNDIAYGMGNSTSNIINMTSIFVSTASASIV